MHSCRIVVPIYRALNDAEIALVCHNLNMMRGFPAVLIGGHGLAGLLAETCAALADQTGADISIETFEDSNFRDVSGYNSLLSEPEFFERFIDCDYVLICQHDAIILKPELQDWLDKGYAFVGSPMFEGFGAPIRPLRYLQTLNGGLSLRHIPSALTVFRNATFLPRSPGIRLAAKLGLIRVLNGVMSLVADRRFVVRRAGLNEDVLWTRDIASVFAGFRVPPPEIAARFAFEVCPADLFERIGAELPFGCHAFERYDPDFWIEHAPREVVPLIRALTPDSGDRD